MKFVQIVIPFLIYHTFCFAQDSSVSEEENTETKFSFVPGIYMDFMDFYYNRPIEPWQIDTDINAESSDFYYHLVKEKKVNVMVNDTIYTIDPRHMWGYSDGKGVYVNRTVFPKGYAEYLNGDVSQNPWAKINIFGTLSLIYFVKIFKNNSPLISSTPRSRNKEAKFILNINNGKICEATLTNLEMLISDDPELSKEFKKFKDKDVKFYIFLKKYNENHPLEFY